MFATSVLLIMSMAFIFVGLYSIGKTSGYNECYEECCDNFCAYDKKEYNQFSVILLSIGILFVGVVILAMINHWET